MKKILIKWFKIQCSRFNLQKIISSSNHLIITSFFCFLPFLAMAQIPSSIFGEYYGNATIKETVFGFVDETIEGVSVELKNTGGANDYILGIPNLGIGMPAEMDNIIITPFGNGYKLTRSEAITFIIPELEIPGLGTFTNVPVSITLENTTIMNNVMDLNMKAVASVSFIIKITINIHFLGELLSPPVITTEELPAGKVGEEYSATLEAEGQTPITWGVFDGELPAGLLLDELTGIISGIPTDSGAFEFAVMAFNEISNDYKMLSIYIRGEDEIIDTTGINKFRFINIEVYPNPTSGELRIESGEWRIENVEIYDLGGKKILSHHLITTSPNHLINISHLQSGIYFVKIKTENKTVIRRIIKI